ncbi:hypothetical protein [Streptomyces sp. NPDC059753]|uniref:hypothetical protein n=1 Tax=Streptomyces sp. NPDC059753 TaxID=3346933 RepID=UPI003668D906
MITIITAVLGLSAGWCIGHRSARIVFIPISGSSAQDDAAFIAEQRARFDQIVAGFDLPDQNDPPRSAA